MVDTSIEEMIEELDRKSSDTFAREQDAERVERKVIRFFSEMDRTQADDDTNDAEDTSDENRRRFNNTERRQKKLIKRDLIRRHKVLMIRVGYNKEADDSYFWECVKIVQSKTMNCMVFVNNVDKNKEAVVRMADKISYLCEWIPVTLKGYLRNFFYCLRSYFTGVMSYGRSLEMPPTIVFVDAHPITIPLLKIFFTCPIVSFGFYDEMLNRNKLTLLPAIAETLPEAIRNFCMTRANELLVPSRTTAYKFTKQVNDCAFSPIAFYPPIVGKKDNGSMFRLKFYFLIVGPWHKYSRMEFALIACQRFYDFVLDDYYKPLVRFVFIGYMDENDEKARDFKIHMYKTFKAAERPFGNCILSFTNPTPSQLAAHYRNCVGVLNVTTCDFAWPVLEAVHFERQVICFANQFSNEIIRHGVNGLLQESNENVFAIQMNNLFTYAIEQMPSFTATKLAKKYSRAGRKNIIDELLLKYFPLTDRE